MRGERLFGLVRAHVQALLHGYVQHPALTREIDRYIVPPALGARSGVLGALALAALADLPPPEDREDAGPAA